MAFSARQGPEGPKTHATTETHIHALSGAGIGPAGRRGGCGRAGGLLAAAAALAGSSAAALGLRALLRVLKLDHEHWRTDESFSATNLPRRHAMRTGRPNEMSAVSSKMTTAIEILPVMAADMAAEPTSA